jgi:hypothetical protein
MQFTRVALEAPQGKLAELAAFYERFGSTALVFEEAAGSPFYHFAFLVPGDRFDAALRWAQGNVEVLPDTETGEPVFDFDNWNARAFYFHDPAGNIVELIAHHGWCKSGAQGEFDPAELLGVSELGLIGDGDEIAAALGRLGLALWDGALAPGGLAFFGERARVLIVAEPGRGWLPTGRPAESHPVDVVIAGLPAGEAVAGPHRIRCVPLGDT